MFVANRSYVCCVVRSRDSCWTFIYSCFMHLSRAHIVVVHELWFDMNLFIYIGNRYGIIMPVKWHVISIINYRFCVWVKKTVRLPRGCVHKRFRDRLNSRRGLASSGSIIWVGEPKRWDFKCVFEQSTFVCSVNRWWIFINIFAGKIDLYILKYILWCFITRTFQL